MAHTFQFAPLSSPFSVQSSSHLPPSDIPKTLAPGASIAQATPKAAPPPPPLPSLHVAAVGSFCCRPCCATHVNFAFSSLSFVHLDIIFRYLPLHQLTLLCFRQARPVAPSTTSWCWSSTAYRFLGFGVWGLGFVVLLHGGNKRVGMSRVAGCAERVQVGGWGWSVQCWGLGFGGLRFVSASLIALQKPQKNRRREKKG